MEGGSRPKRSRQNQSDGTTKVPFRDALGELYIGTTSDLAKYDTDIVSIVNTYHRDAQYPIAVQKAVNHVMGRGLFAVNDIPPDVVITEYGGITTKVPTEEDTDHGMDESYILILTPEVTRMEGIDLHVNALVGWRIKEAGRWMNHALQHDDFTWSNRRAPTKKRYANVYFQFTKWPTPRIQVIAARRIRRGEEILVEYRPDWTPQKRVETGPMIMQFVQTPMCFYCNRTAWYRCTADNSPICTNEEGTQCYDKHVLSTEH